MNWPDYAIGRDAIRTAEAACTAWRSGVGYEQAHLAHLVAYAQVNRFGGLHALVDWNERLEWLPEHKGEDRV